MNVRGSELPKLSGLEEMVLRMLVVGGDEMYGLELVDKSDGLIARGSIYVTLSRMADKGLVDSRTEDRPKYASGIPRRLYRPTGVGAMAYRASQRSKAATLGTIQWVPSCGA